MREPPEALMYEAFRQQLASEAKINKDKLLRDNFPPWVEVIPWVRRAWRAAYEAVPRNETARAVPADRPTTT